MRPDTSVHLDVSDCRAVRRLRRNDRRRAVVGPPPPPRRPPPAGREIACGGMPPSHPHRPARGPPARVRPRTFRPSSSGTRRTSSIASRSIDWRPELILVAVPRAGVRAGQRLPLLPPRARRRHTRRVEGRRPRVHVHRRSAASPAILRHPTGATCRCPPTKQRRDAVDHRYDAKRSDHQATIPSNPPINPV